MEVGPPAWSILRNRRQFLIASFVLNWLSVFYCSWF